MNNVVLAGRLTHEPELKTTNTGIEVMSFSLAVNREYTKQGEEKQADFINCVAWRKTAVFISTYFHKGDGIVLNGRLEGRRYVDKDGNNRTAYEVVAERVEFPLGKGRDNSSFGTDYGQTNTSQTPGYSAPPATAPTVPAAESQQLPIDDDLPF